MLRAFFGSVKDLLRKDWLKREVGWADRKEDELLCVGLFPCGVSQTNLSDDSL